MSGQNFIEINLPSPAYALDMSDYFAVLATSFPDNAIRCYNIQNGELKWRIDNESRKTIKKLEIEGEKIHIYDPKNVSKLFSVSIEDGSITNDYEGIFVINELNKRLSYSLKNNAKIMSGWNVEKEFPIPLVAVAKVEGLAGQVDINIWSHTSDEKQSVLKTVEDVLKSLKEKIIVQSMQDITDEESGVKDDLTGKTIRDSKPVFRKNIQLKILATK